MEYYIKMTNFSTFVFLILSCMIGIDVCSSVYMKKNPKIIIVGAGAAGIAAASKLFEYGFKNVTILEAENRIGGRIYTEQLGDYFVDLGGQWVHGEKGNAAYELANPLDLLDVSNQPYFGLEQEFYDSVGDPVNEDLARNVTNFYFKYVHEADLNKNHSFTSIGDYVEKMFVKEFNNYSDILKEKKKYLHQLELDTISIDSAESWHNMSALTNDLQYKECPGDQIINWKTRGYSTILDILMKRYPDPKKELPVRKNIRLNSEVILIDYLNGTEGPPVLVTTKNGLISADHVIVTVSLGVLKEQHNLLFMPPLPDFKVKTIEALGFGNVAKIFLLFQKPFWNLNGRRIVHFSFLWNEAEMKQIEGDPEKLWLLGMSGARTVEYKPNLLELWISGKYAKAMEKLSKDKVFNHSVENLHRFLDKKFIVTKPIAMLRTQWYTNPHFRGTYSYRSVNTEKQKVSAEMLEKPLNSKNLTLLFAGEATSHDRFSTVDGAIASGWKAANRLLNHYKKILPVE